MIIEHSFKIKDKVKPLAGIFVGRTGSIEAIAENAPKCIGVRFPLEKGEGFNLLTWYEPDTLELCGD